MALILSIETADEGCSVAIHQSDRLIGFKEILDKQSSSSLLTTIIAEVCSDAGCVLKDLEAIAISKGPGSYTGLRIGVSTAKGLCFGLDIPLISVNTLDALVWANLSDTCDFICPMLDARRMEVYCKITTGDGSVTLQETNALVIETDSFDDYLNRGTMLFCGPGAVKCKPILGDKSNVYFEKHLTRVTAVNMGVLAFRNFEQEQFEDLEVFEPFYLKDFLVKKSQKKTLFD